MPREFFNDTIEFDENKHLTTREIWDSLAKQMLANFEIYVSTFKKSYNKELEKTEKTEAQRKVLSLWEPEILEKIEARRGVLNKRLEMIAKYENAYWEEQSGLAERGKNPKLFLEKRKAMTRVQEDLVRALKEDFMEAAAIEFDFLAAHGSKRLEQIESDFAKQNYGILPVKKPDKKGRVVHPDFIRQLDKNTLGANVINESLFKILKQEREVIDERLHPPKERPY